MPDPRLLVTCEHGGSQVPPELGRLFPASSRDVLESHRGFDAGALSVARALAERLRAPLLFSETTRLVVDLNRSPHHPRLWSEFTRQLGAEDKRLVLDAHYAPYRSAVESAVREAVAAGGRVLHVSSHSFTPELLGAVRTADVGLLFDPTRPAEADWARRWQVILGRVFPSWKIRRNYPYRGTADGLTTHLRRVFPDPDYAGIELEINQRRVFEADWAAYVDSVATSLEMLVASR